jgi:hypothetical protein
MQTFAHVELNGTSERFRLRFPIRDLENINLHAYVRINNTY